MRLLALLLAATTFSFAADDAPRPNNRNNGQPDQPNQPRGNNQGRLPAGLSPNEQQKLRAAMEKAHQNPAVKEAMEQAEQKERVAQEARRKVMELTEDAARQADPEVAPLLEKLHKSMENNRNRQPTPEPRANEGRNNNQPRPPQGEPRANEGRNNNQPRQPEGEPRATEGRKNAQPRQPEGEAGNNVRGEAKGDRSNQGNRNGLTPDEQKRLHEAVSKANQDPEVKAAHEAAAAAQKKQFEITEAAALKADPSLAPIFEKMKGTGEPRRAPQQ